MRNRSFSHIYQIARRELVTSFHGPVAYILLVLYVVISAYFFTSGLIETQEASLRSFFSMMPIVFLVIIPGVSMRLLAEERKSGTLELLVTLPVRDWEVVLGKFLAGAAFLVALLLASIAFPITVAWLGDPDWGPIWGGYIALLLLGGSFLSIGIFASSLTRNQVVALVISFVICLLLLVIAGSANYIPGFFGDLLVQLSLATHFSNISRGVLDTRDLLYYFSVMIFFLHLTTQSLAARKQ